MNMPVAFEDFVQTIAIDDDDIVHWRNEQWTAERHENDVGYWLQHIHGKGRELLTHREIADAGNEFRVHAGKNSKANLEREKLRKTRDFEDHMPTEKALARTKGRVVEFWQAARGGDGASRQQSLDALQGAYDRSMSEMVLRHVKHGDPVIKLPKPGLSTLYKWQAELRESNYSLRSLIDGRSQHSGNQTRRLTIAQERFVDEVIWLCSNTEQMPTTQAYDKVEFIYQADPKLSKIPLPAVSTVYSRIAQMGKAVRDYLRLGKEAYQPIYKSTGVGLRNLRPAALLQVDAMMFDLHTIIGHLSDYKQLNRRQRRALATERIWVVVVIDTLTRCVLGFAFGLSESTAVARSAVRMAFSDKSELAKQAGCRSPYPMRAGYGARFLTDNGSAYMEEFTGSVVDSLCGHQKAPVGAPWLRGVIERFFRRLAQQFFTYFTGRVFGSAQERRTDKGPRATIFTQEIPQHFTRYVVDIYHPVCHRGLGISPFRMWVQACENSPPAAHMPDEKLSAIFGIHVDDVSLSSDGIEINGLQYHDEELQKLFEYLGPTGTVPVRYDEMDLGGISVRLDKKYVAQRNQIEEDPVDRHWIRVPCLSGLRGIPVFVAQEVSDRLLAEYGADDRTSEAIADAGKAYLHEASRQAQLRALYQPEPDPDGKHAIDRRMHPGLREAKRLLNSPLVATNAPRKTGAKAHLLGGADAEQTPTSSAIATDLVAPTIGKPTSYHNTPTARQVTVKLPTRS